MRFKLDTTPAAMSPEQAYSRISMEAFADVSEIIDTFRLTIPSLTDKLTNLLDSITSGQDDAQMVGFAGSAKVFRSKIQPRLSVLKFTDYAKTLVPAPEGFEGEYVAYAGALLRMSTPLFKDALETLAQYNSILASFVTNKEDRLSLQDHTHFYTGVKRTRETLTAELAVFFPERSQKQKVYLGDLISRFQDMEDLLELIEKLSRERKKAALSDIKQGMRKSVDLLNIVIKNAQEKSISAVSPTAAMNVAAGAYELGKYVELISIYAFKVEQLVSAVQALVSKFEEITN